MSDPNLPLPQDAFRSRQVSEEDKYYAQREQEILEDLQASRAARTLVERRCPNGACGSALLDRVMHDSVEIDQCPVCKGIWLDAGELEILSGRSKSQSGVMRFFRNLAGDYSA